MNCSFSTWLAASVLVGVGCQVQPPEPVEPLRPVSPEVLDRFRFGAPEAQPTLSPVHILGESAEADDEGKDAPVAAIEIEDLLQAVEAHFPLILAALDEVDVAEGRVLQARGGFDTVLGSKNRFDVEGFYESNAVGIELEQPTTLWGSTFSGGYRLGDGDFADYDGKLKTNEGGEFRLGVSVPILQGGSIDPRRVELWQALIAEERAQPVVMQKRLETTRKAADAYWRWVSWGRRREIALRLLALAEDRQGQVELAVQAGELARINLADNQRQIVERRSKLVQAERGLQQAAILLSLYWRDAEGRPVVPGDAALPYEFPTPRDPNEVLVPDAVELAVTRRPEVRAIELELSGLQLDESLARNQLLPNLDLGLYASQDVGGAVNQPDDKGPFELQALLLFKVPLQRRSPRGKVAVAEAKIAKLQRELQFTRDIVTTDVLDAASALRQTWEQLAQARESVRLAGELAEAERILLRAGDSDLFRVNLREQQAGLAASSLVDVLDAHFRAHAQYRAVLGITYDEVRSGQALGGGPRQ